MENETSIEHLAVVNVENNEVLVSIQAGRMANVYETALFWMMDTRTEKNVGVEALWTALADGTPVLDGYDDVLWVRLDNSHAFERSDVGR